MIPQPLAIISLPLVVMYSFDDTFYFPVDRHYLLYSQNLFFFLKIYKIEDRQTGPTY